MVNNKSPKQIIPRATNFADWYTSLITAANLALYSSIKGEIIFQPKAWEIWSSIQNYLNNIFSKLEIQNIALPTFIRYSDFIKEKEHVIGFAPEVFLVENKGNEKLVNPYVIRPTSEVLFCEYFKKIVTSYKDLPVKVNQWCNVFRAEKNTRPFLRTSEFYWHEMHSIHSDHSEAKKMCENMIQAYHKLLDEFLLIPTICGEKTVGERFAGADHTFTLEALMQDGQALQCATAHDLDHNFAKTYDITFTNSKNEKQYVYQTSAGTSTRLIGALIMTHSDDYGLVLPFDIANPQFAILSINASKEPKVIDVCNDLKDKIQNLGYKVIFDNSNNSFGYKINDVEVKGVPFAIIVGPNDITNNTITIYRRDTREKITMSIDKLFIQLQELISSYQNNLYDRAKKNLENRIVTVDNMKDFETALKQGKFILALWGGDEKDEKELKKITGATPRCILKEINENKLCFFTKKRATHLVYFARAY